MRKQEIRGNLEMLRVVNGCSVVGRVTVEGQTSLFSALV